MPNRALWRSLHSLIHPITIGSIALLLINDHVLKDQFASWWTGKLSDIAGLIFAPLICSVLLALIIPKSHRQQEKLVAIFAFGLTGLVFALSNTLPAAKHFTENIWTFVSGHDATMWRDPTDLLALPTLLIGWRIWKQASNRPLRRPILQYTVLAGGLLAAMATSASPYNQGIECIVEHDGDLYAYNDWITETKLFSLSSGDQEWEPRDGQPVNLPKQCTNNRVSEWLETDPIDPNVMWQINRRESIDLSTDGGNEWQKIIDLRWISSRSRARALDRIPGFPSLNFYGLPLGPVNSYYDSQTNHLWLAMGLDGVLRVSIDGSYDWITVGDNRLEGVETINISTVHWWTHFLLAITSAFLTLAIGPISLERNCLIIFFGTILILFWAIAVADLHLSPFPSRYSHFENNGSFILGIAACVIAIVTIAHNLVYNHGQSALDYHRLYPFALATGSIFLFLYMHWWKRGSNPLIYPHTTYIAILLVILCQITIMITVRRWYPLEKTPHDWFKEYALQATQDK